jgi:RNA polymerase sigma-70 factor (ECF subfamily)
LKSARQAESPAPSDGEVLARLGSGDLEALGTLYDRYEHAIRRFLCRLGVTDVDLDDLVQLTFLEVVRAAKRFDPRCAVRPWLFGVAATMARRHRRRFAQMAARVKRFVTARDPDSGPETPDEAFDARETERRFRRALDALSDKKRDVFVMVTLEGASGEEAAMALGIPINTVWTRLHHAREDLRRMLSEDAP